MSLKDLNLKLQYRSLDQSELVDNFYVPILSEAILYQRAVGYFSSSLLFHLSKGISKMIGRNGRIEIIASPDLSNEDIKAIENGYASRKQIIESSLLDSLQEPKSSEERERFNYLAHLISTNIMDIKIAVLRNTINKGIYHEKFGLVKDKDGNRIAFTGSLNETGAGIKLNFESIDVFCDWKNEIDKERIEQKHNDFDKLWNNKTKRVQVYRCPDAIKKKILKYKKEDIIEEKEPYLIPSEKKILTIPQKIKLRDYQKEAVKEWLGNKAIGIMNMATGTGKTITALAATKELINKLNEKNLFVLIVCPYKHLVEQWAEEVENFNQRAIKISSDYKWETKLKNKIHRYNEAIINELFVITTNASFKSKKFQRYVKKINKDILLIIDEVHNAGTIQFLNNLDEKYTYRLGLSATPKRYYDNYGTKKIEEFFQKEVYKYGLKKAINDGYLSKYYYYPQFVYLNNKEFNQYIKLSKEASAYIRETKEGTKITDKGKRILIERARIIAGVEDKVKKLKDLFIENKDSYYNLVYCGATYVEEKITNDEIRQIEAVTKMLGYDYNMKVKKFTAEESLEERSRIIKEFSDGHSLQVVVAIKCLDEGVNIPSIKNAYILSSSSNPKEFIQRRGRVLRKSENKNFAYIYDFICLPRKTNQIHLQDEKILKYDISLLRKEMNRALEFSELAENKHSAREPLLKIIEVYKDYTGKEIL